MSYCKTCTHWNKSTVGFLNERLGGYCMSEKLMEEGGSEDYQEDTLVYPYPEGAGFWTGAKFGCVHHKVKEIK